MMMRQGNRLICAVAAFVFWGLFLFAGCEQEQKPAPPPPKPIVISKRITQPESETPTIKTSDASVPAEAQTPGSTTGATTGSTTGSTTGGPAVSTDTGKDKTVKAMAEKPGSTMPSPPAQPVTEEQAKKEQDEAKSATATPLFKSDQPYDTKGRVDPFIPLLTEKQAAPAQPEAGGKPEEPKRMLTPLEKLDLSQIKLVAIIQAGSRTLAMVEEANGKGYEVRLGTYMGTNGGQVTAIHPDSLTVTEQYTDYQGKRRERAQEIKFHKNEGGE